MRIVALWIVLWMSSATASSIARPSWRVVTPGVEYAELAPASNARDLFQVVRVDPTRARLRAVMASQLDTRARTAGSWCDEQKLVAAINLGMFLDDHLSNVGFARSGGHVNQGRWSSKYQSALAFGPRRAGLPAAVLIDLDEPGARARLDEYDTVIQNLRLVRAPGKNVWTEQPRRWSEAAVAIDRAGRVLFVFARAPHSMFEFNRLLLALPLDVTAAMHVEGGPEASLSLRGAIHLDLNGSYETGFVENDDVRGQWEIPNVLGVSR
jgi:hypothetical protein